MSMASQSVAMAKYEVLGGKAIGVVAGYDTATIAFSNAVGVIALPVLGVVVIAILCNQRQKIEKQN